MRGSWALTSSTLVALTIVACATAGGEFQAGTERFDASQPPAPGPAANEASAPCVIENGSGEKWSDLYRDLFGPTGKPGSCSFQGFCHGAADQSGAVASGIVCGASKDECREKLIANGWLKEADKTAPDQSGLLSGLLRLRQADGSQIGFMPQQPSDCYYSAASVDRIKKWIANGIPND